jgi:hypothetical protein
MCSLSAQQFPSRFTWAALSDLTVPTVATRRAFPHESGKGAAEETVAWKHGGKEATAASFSASAEKRPFSLTPRPPPPLLLPPPPLPPPLPQRTPSNSSGGSGLFQTFADAEPQKWSSSSCTGNI